ncbi:MAG: MFS transporter, partial [Chloroflexota bacterium]
MTSEALPKTEQRSFLRGNVLAFSFVSLLQDTASEMIYLLLPTFLTGVLLAPVAVV